MNFDEIGEQIIASGATEALHALTFQVSRSWQLINADKKLNTKNLPLAGTDNKYLTLSDSHLTLTTKNNLTFDKTVSDLKLQARALRKRFGSELLLWPFSENLHASSLKSGSKIKLTLPEKLFSELYTAKFSRSKIPYVTFRNQVYTKLENNFKAHKAFLIYLFGATPYVWQDQSSTSPKRSVKALEMLEDGIKVGGNYQELGEEKTKGIHFLEFDLLDLDPFQANGVTLHQLRLLEVMAGYFLMTKDETTKEKLAQADALAKEVASENPFAKSKVYVGAHAFLKKLDRFAKKYGYIKWQGTVDVLEKRLQDPNETPSTRLLRDQGKHETLADYGIFLAKKYQEAELLKAPLREQNTQTLLDQAIVEGLDYQEVMPDKAIIEINGHLVKRGIQTTKESAIMTELWADKQMAKQFLSNQNVNISQAWTISERHEAKTLYKTIKNKAVIVKDALGDSSERTRLFRMPPTQGEFIKALEEQFETSKKVMVEQVVQGSIYRALVVNDEIISLVERIPANVVGDGRSTLKELIERKNTRARAAFEVINLSDIEKETLKAQGLKLDSVIARGTQVLLRYDATYGTGSQAYEVLDEIDKSYLTELKRISEVLQLHDGAIDIIIPNIYREFTEKEQLTFLNAHAFPALALNEYVLLKQEKQPIAQKIIANFH